MRGEVEAVGSAAFVRMRPGNRGRPFRIFATWIADERGPMFCRWTEPATERDARPDVDQRPDGELRD